MSEPVNLDLWQSAIAGQQPGPVNLDLGSSAVVETKYIANISAKARKTRAHISVAPMTLAVMSAHTVVAKSKIKSTFDINVSRGPTGTASCDWHKAVTKLCAGTTNWCSGVKSTAAIPIKWTGNVSATEILPFMFKSLDSNEAVKIDRCENAKSAVSRADWLYRDIPSVSISRTDNYCEATRTGFQHRTRFWSLLPRVSRIDTDHWRTAARHDASVLNQLFSKGRFVSAVIDCFYEEAIWPLPGVSDHTLPPVTPPLNIGDVNLNFYCERQLNTDLEFWVDIGAARIIPIRRVYLVSNTASIVRARDGLDIPSISVSIDYDDDSWAWQFSATVPLISIAEALDGEDVIITLNGYEWRMSVDGWSDNKSWNSQSATVTGRSRTKELSSSILLPASYAETQDRTIIQLAEQELITGWTIDWQAADWLVPGGAWSYSNKAPMDIITELAEAAGAFVMPDRVNRHMTILPKYKTAPWHLDGVLADIQIPADIMINRGRKREYGTNANGVWLTGGQKNTITARVKRAGSAGERLLSDTTNALISHVDGARALGTKLLAESLDRSLDTIELPISSTDTGLILPGMILDIPDGKSYARGFKATAQKNSDHKLVVRQSIDIERPIIV